MKKEGWGQEVLTGLLYTKRVTTPSESLFAA